jgi:proline iminopeptidase
VADLDALRRHLGIARWLVVGGSWGASLGLAYASAHRADCLGLLLRGSFLTGEPDLRWFLGGPAEGAGALKPEPWAQLVSLPGLHTGSRATEVLAVHADLIEQGWHALNDNQAAVTTRDIALARQALAAWLQWEQALGAPGQAPCAKAATPLHRPPRPDHDDTLRALLAKYRIQLRYLRERCFLGEAALLDAAASLEGLPGLVLHGQLDLVCRPRNAWLLHQAWPGSVLQWVSEAGHDPFGSPMLAAMQAQVSHFTTHGAFAHPDQGLTP